MHIEYDDLFQSFQAFIRKLKGEQKQESLTKEIHKGVDRLVKELSGDAPWRARWPRGKTFAQLTKLMVIAAHANCPLICSFLYQAGAESFSTDKNGSTPLHAALEAKHWTMAKQILGNMGGSLYLPDGGRRLPTDMITPELLHQLEEVSDFVSPG